LILADNGKTRVSSVQSRSAGISPSRFASRSLFCQHMMDVGLKDCGSPILYTGASVERRYI